MNRNTGSLCLLVSMLAGLSGCSSGPAPTESTKPAAAIEKIQGKAQVLLAETSAADAALNAGGQSVYLWEGVRRYRLFLKTPFEIVGGNEYVVEGINAQKAIDEIGDPDNGKNGYPLASSCERVVKMAWSGLSFDVADGQASALRTRVKRYPARPVFLVTKIQPLTKDDSAAKKVEDKDKDKDVKEIEVAADKQKAALIEGPPAQPAPLWEPAGGTANCKVVIGTEGKIAELDTGNQLCEAVPWAKFKYQPPVQGGHPVKVRTEVAVQFEPRK